MNILVTGGAGYIGSIAVELLLEWSHHPIVLDNLQEGHRSAVPHGASFYEGDFGDCKLLRKIFAEHSIDAVLHFAAETTVEWSMSDPARYFDNNTVKSIRLLDVMRKFRCNRLVFSSTAATFGEPQYTPIDEKHPTNPINAYGESKLMFEKVLRWYHRAYGLKYVSFRYFNAAGATESLGEDHRHESHLIPLVIQAAVGKRQYVDVFGSNYPTKDGTCVRDFIHVLDLAEAHILALQRIDEIGAGFYNLGNGDGFTVLEVIRTVEEVSGRRVPYRMANRRPGDPAVLVACSEKARRELGWRPRFADLRDIVESAWRWHLAHPHGYGD